MQHSNFCNRSGWEESSFITAKASQIEMIKRAYPEYDENNDWVLWIVPALYHDREPDELLCEIEIKRADNSILEKEYVLRQPYPNKRIVQASLVPKDRRKRVYGIPLVFSTFEEVKEIAEVRILWKFFENKTYGIEYITTEIKYILEFKENEMIKDARFFTIYSKDMTSTVELEDDTIWTNYLNEFDIMLIDEATIELFDDENAEVIISDSFCYTNSNYDESVADVDVSEYFNRKTRIKAEDENRIRKQVEDALIKEEVQYYPSFYKKKETLVASEMADIIPEECFGFKYNTQTN